MFCKVKFYGLFFLLALLGLGTLYYKQAYRSTDGFSTEKIQFEFPYHAEWETHLSKEQKDQINQILTQRFTYLGKGARAFSFLSQDGQYVLKFFKYRYHTPHWAVRILPAIFPFEPYRQRKMQKVSLDTVLNGYKIAFDHDPIGTGLLYVHLNPTIQQHPIAIVTDKQGKEHLVDLDNTRFVLQKKVRELTDLLNELMRNQDIGQAKYRINQVFDLYLFHYNHGLHDLGMGILRNNGFIEDEPIHFDVGKMTLDSRISDSRFHREKMIKMAKKVKQWFGKNYPEHQKEITHSLEEKLLQIYHEKITL